MGFIGSVVGGILGSHAAHQASQAEQQGAQQAQQVSKENQNAANEFQTGVLNKTTAAEQPYQQVGATAANNLNTLLKTGFQAPTLQQAENTPGYQFQLQQGARAINQNAAANGMLMTGNTGVALQNYGQNLAQNAYQQTYNNALNTFQANQQANQAGVNAGLNSTGQLGQFGQAAANNISSTDLTAAQQQMQQINNAAAARASGYLGSAGAWSNAFGGLNAGIGNLDFTGSSTLPENALNFFTGV